jgi:phage shock protein PspC (stress-responsive transcriptional regulator)
MSYRTAPIMQGSWISGVCADIAERAALPVWVPRAGFVVFGMMHWLLAAILYFALARILRPRTRDAQRSPFTAPTSPPPPYGFGPLQDRYRNLDARLSTLEAATVRNEEELRRAFRDLERR